MFNDDIWYIIINCLNMTHVHRCFTLCKSMKTICSKILEEKQRDVKSIWRKDKIFKSAVYEGDYYLINYLVSIGAKYAYDTMYIAGKTGNLRMIEFLLIMGAGDAVSAIGKAAKYGHNHIIPGIIRLMKMRNMRAIGYAHTSYELSAIHNAIVVNACRSNNMELLLEYVDYLNMDCVSVAVDNPFLFDYVVDNQKEYIFRHNWFGAMANCCKKGDIDMLNHIISRFHAYNHDVIEVNWDILYANACSTGNIDFVENIANMAERDGIPITPVGRGNGLCFACKKDLRGMMRYLLAFGIDDEWLLNCACIYAGKDLIDDMNKMILDVDITNDKWKRLFDAAVYNNCKAVIDHIIEKGVIRRDHYKWSIQTARTRGHGELATYLDQIKKKS